MMEDLLSPDEGFSIAERPAKEEEVGGNPRVLEDIVLGIVRSGALYRIDSAEAETVEPGDRILSLLEVAHAADVEDAVSWLDGLGFGGVDAGDRILYVRG